jgi:hypothetical protein
VQYVGLACAVPKMIAQHLIHRMYFGTTGIGHAQPAVILYCLFAAHLALLRQSDLASNPFEIMRSHREAIFITKKRLF